MFPGQCWRFLVSLVGLAATFSTIGCEDNAERLKVEASMKDARAIQKAAVTAYKPGGDCPKTAELWLPKDFKTRGVHDAWGNPFKVVCSGNDVKVIAAGPDRKEGTDDDIRSN